MACLAWWKSRFGGMVLTEENPAFFSSLGGVDNTSHLLTPQIPAVQCWGYPVTAAPHPAQQRPGLSPPAASMWPKGVSYASLACVSPIWVVCGTHTDAHMHPRMHACLFTPEGLSLNSMLSEGREDHILLFSHSWELDEISRFSADPAFTSSGRGGNVLGLDVGP